MEEYRNNGDYGVDKKQMHAGAGWKTGNLFGVAFSWWYTVNSASTDLNFSRIY